MNASSVPTRVPPERAPDRPTSATRPARGTRESRGGFDRMLRVGDRLVPVAADPETGAARLGGNVVVADVRVASAEVAEADGERIVRGWLEGPVDAPFVRGVARFEVADGTITGRVRVRADVGVLGAVVTQLAYEAHTDDGLPLPAVAVGEDGVHVELDGRLEDGALVAETPAAAMEADEKATDVASRARARSQGAPLPPGVRDQLALLLGEAPADVVLHTDKAAADATAALGADALVDDPDVYVAPDRWKPETAEGLDLLVRAVTQALARVSGPVLPASELVDPSEPSAEPQPRPAVTAPQPPRPAPGAGPTPRPEPGPWMALREEPAAEAPEPQEAVVGDLAALAPEERAPEVADGDGVALLMPPAPAEPTPAAQARASGVRSRARTAATSARELPPADALTGAAREAVTEPPEETVARAEAAITDVLSDRPPPSPAIVALASEIRTAIRAKRPIDEKDLVKANPDEMAREAGASLNAAVEGEAAQVQGSYDELNEVTPGAPSQVGAPLTPHVPGFADSGIDATQGVPDLIPDEDLSLDADRDAIQQRIDEAEIERDTTEPINEPPFSTVRAGSEELDELAQEGPAEIAARQDAALAQASADLAALQAQAMAALAQSRTSAVSDVDQRQGTMVGDEGRTREAISAEASRIFTDAQMRVNTMLDPLTRTAISKWDAGVQRHATTFRQTLRRVEEWIKERHSGVGGFFVKGWDRLTGLPRWVTREYDRAERRFGDDVSALLLEISSDVNAVIVAAEAVIDDARERIDRLFDDLPVELQAWAEDQRAAFHQRLDGLQHRVTQTRDGFERDLARSALSTVNEVRAEVEALREQARGLIGQIADAIEAFLDDPVRAIIDGLLRLVGIPPLAFWALVERIKQVISDIADDPINFVSNLLAAVGQGFERFFDSFPSHLLKGFFDWLFSGLGSVGVQIPRDLSLKSLITFALQLMGITWPRIREILVRHIGEENVALIEQAWQLVMTLVQQGPEGIFEMIKDRLDPQTLLQMVLDAAIDYIVETLVAQAVRWLASLLTPAGAIVKAIEVIYQVLRWIFQNAARIFRFVETIVNGMADIVAGRIGPMAEAVEKALASLLVVVIDFLMGLVGLGDLPDKVVSVIKGLQARVHEILERIIAWLVERGRALLTALGLREEGEEEAAEPATAEDLELGTTVTFAAVGNTHRHWVDVTGTNATLMVASETAPVSTYLAEWRSWSSLLPASLHDEASGLLDAASSLHEQTDATADQLVEAFRQAQSGGQEPAPPGQQLEPAQQELVRILRRLFEIFAIEAVPFEPVTEHAEWPEGSADVTALDHETAVILRIGGELGTALVARIRANRLAAAVLDTPRQELTHLDAVDRVSDSLGGFSLDQGALPQAERDQVPDLTRKAAAGIAHFGKGLKLSSLERGAVVERTQPFNRRFRLPRSPNTHYTEAFREEFRRQLAEQQAGMNEIHLDDWMLNLAKYSATDADLERLDSEGRRAVYQSWKQRAESMAERAVSRGQALQEAADDIDAWLQSGDQDQGTRPAILSRSRLKQLGIAGRFGDEASWRRKNLAAIETLRVQLQARGGYWAEQAANIENLVILHNPDQIAGGEGEIRAEFVAVPGPDATDEEIQRAMDALGRVVGARRINSSLGPQWRREIKGLPDAIAGVYPIAAWPIWKLNVHLNEET